MLLGDLGADVVKVEKPEVGDEARSFMFLGASEFLALNRNKRSITLNLKTVEDKKVLTELVREGDVIVENFRPGVMDRLGFGYEQTRSLNPSLIFCSITGFGQDGPYSDRGAWDPVIQALIGIQKTTGEEGQPPVRIGSSLFDAISGMYAALAIMAALRTREQRGRGERIDISMLDCGLTMMMYWIPYFAITGKLPPKMGTGWPGIAPYEIFKAQDRYVFLAASNERFWEDLCNALGLRNLLGDSRFASNEHRVHNRVILHDILGSAISKLRADAVVDKLASFGIPCAPVCTVEEAVNNPQVKHRGMIQEFEYPGLPKVKIAGIPFKFSDTEFRMRLTPPLLGQHTNEILNKLSRS